MLLPALVVANDADKIWQCPGTRKGVGSDLGGEREGGITLVSESEESEQREIRTTEQWERVI